MYFDGRKLSNLFYHLSEKVFILKGENLLTRIKEGEQILTF